MTDKERFNRKIVEHWYRTQLSILEDVIYNYETGLATFEMTEEMFKRNVKYIGLKYMEDYLPNDLYEEYSSEAERTWTYILELKEIKGGDPMCK